MYEEFKDATIEFLTFENGSPKEDVLQAAQNLENTGLDLVISPKGMKVDNLISVTTDMQKVFKRIGNLELVPPLTDEEKGMLAGKVATFSSIMDRLSTTNTAIPPKPTDPKALSTSKPKK